jgi:hypothetical protein
VLLGQREPGAGPVRQDNGDREVHREHGLQDRPGTRDKDCEAHLVNVAGTPVVPRISTLMVSVYRNVHACPEVLTAGQRPVAPRVGPSVGVGDARPFLNSSRSRRQVQGRSSCEPTGLPGVNTQCRHRSLVPPHPRRSSAPPVVPCVSGGALPAVALWTPTRPARLSPPGPVPVRPRPSLRVQGGLRARGTIPLSLRSFCCRRRQCVNTRDQRGRLMGSARILGPAVHPVVDSRWERRSERQGLGPARAVQTCCDRHEEPFSV